MDFKSPFWGTSGRWVAQSVQGGRVKAKLGRRIKMRLLPPHVKGNVCNDALHVVGLQGPGDKISVSLQDWESAKVALSCHMVLDVLCQEMHEAW